MSLHPHLPPDYPEAESLTDEPPPFPNSLLYDEVLPSYANHVSPSAPRKEFKYAMERDGEAWAHLLINADPVLSKNMPTILEGSNLVGSFQMHLNTPESIRSVAVTIQGQITHGAELGEQYVFWKREHPLWSMTQGDPRNSSSSNAQRFTDKLKGEYSWPISAAVPREVVLPIGPNKTPTTFRLPQTFVEKFTRATVQYDIIVTIKRGKLRPASRIQISFGYIPKIQPPPPSLLRSLAYESNSPLLGPESDPDGWLPLRPVRIRGKVFAQRAVDAKCILSLAKPLCYTRGSVIPCCLSIETDDIAALDLLSSPKAVMLRLRRFAKHSARPEAVHTHLWKDAVTDSHEAVWWPAPHDDDRHTSPSIRHLQGELHLPAALKPTSHLGSFSVQYKIALFPFEAAAFESADKDPLLTEPVEIATMYASGPRPRTYAPPGYKAPFDLPPPITPVSALTGFL